MPAERCNNYLLGGVGLTTSNFGLETRSFPNKERGTNENFNLPCTRSAVHFPASIYLCQLTVTHLNCGMRICTASPVKDGTGVWKLGPGHRYKEGHPSYAHSLTQTVIVS